MEDGIHDECDLYLYQFSEQGYWNSPYNTVLDLCYELLCKKQSYFDMAVQRNQLYFRYCYNWAIFVEFCLER
jgi:hypothetical protein